MLSTVINLLVEVAKSGIMDSQHGAALMCGKAILATASNCPLWDSQSNKSTINGCLKEA